MKLIKKLHSEIIDNAYYYYGLFPEEAKLIIKEYKYKKE